MQHYARFLLGIQDVLEHLFLPPVRQGGEDIHKGGRDRGEGLQTLIDKQAKTQNAEIKKDDEKKKENGTL